MGLAARKRELRRQLSAARHSVGPSSAEVAGAAVAAAVAESAEFRAAPAVALYAALPWELPTIGLFGRAIAASKPCFLPRCMPGTALDFVAIDRWEALVAGSFGLLEPPTSMPAAPLPLGTLVIVPGIAFDLEGNRLGQGMGYYDRAFPRDDARGLTLFGVGFAFQLVERVPVGEFDRSMDAVVTERGISRPGAS